MSHRNYSITENISDKEKSKLELIHFTYKNQRMNINYDFNEYLINKYCKFNCKSSFWTLFSSLDSIGKTFQEQFNILKKPIKQSFCRK
jgi:hypothetical protein